MSRWANKYVIGLTGNIAVGKSLVRQMLQHLGAYTIDADGLAHHAMSPGAPAYKPVVENFGQMILNPDKSINRTALGRIVFSNPEMLKKLEELTHPVIRGAINTLVTRAKQPIVVIEAIKLLDGDLKDSVDQVWVVDASPKSQYIRLVTKRKMSEADAKQRILAQGKQNTKLQAADVVIKNDGNPEETWKQVQAGWNKIPKQAPPAQSPTPTATATPASTAPAKSAPAQPASAPATSAPSAGAVDTSGVTIKRGMPDNAEAIATFINKHSGQNLSRMDVMMSFGDKSYLLAHDNTDTLQGIMGFQVENLITRVDSVYLDAGADKTTIIHALVAAVEEKSIELQSEVSFYFLPSGTDQAVVQPFINQGYEATTIKEIKIPAWREAVNEVYKDGTQILTKKLREDRVLKPI